MIGQCNTITLGESTGAKLISYFNPRNAVYMTGLLGIILILIWLRCPYPDSMSAQNSHLGQIFHSAFQMI